MSSIDQLSSNSLFSSLVGQPQVRSYFEQAIQADKLSHAYLFLGVPGSGKTAAAHLLAHALICPDKGCLACDECRRVSRHTHPDVHEYHPQGASGYLVEQVRELLEDVELAPIRARHKVYIIHRADLLSSFAANALLKTLEEPPFNVTFILIGRTKETMLATIVSRCQVVPFASLSQEQLVEILRSETGVSHELALRALSATGLSIDRARSFLLSGTRQQVRATLLEGLSRLPQADNLDVLNIVKKIVREVKAPLDDIKSAQAAMLEENSDFLSRGAMKALEERHKRELNAHERAGIQELFIITRSYMRDVLGVIEGSTRCANDDVEASIIRMASQISAEQALQIVAAIERAQELFDRNVTPQLTLEVLFFDMKEVL